MYPLPGPSLVEQAKSILEAAVHLQAQLDANALPQPTFTPDGRRDWSDASAFPEILQSRSALLDATQKMRDLALGPMDKMAHLTGPAWTELEVLETLDALGVPQAVPTDGSIALPELAFKLSVNQALLHRQLRFAYLRGIFYEPEEGFVAHTSLSAVIPRFSAILQLKTTSALFKGIHKIPEALSVPTEASGMPRSRVPCELADERGRTFWQQLKEDYPDGRGMERFSAGMKAFLSNDIEHYFRGFNWAALGEGEVIDVGGGSGHIEVGLVKKISHLNFIVQDQPMNEVPARAMIRQNSAESRIAFKTHNFFEPQPEGAQPKAYLLSRVLRDWQDEDCIRILQPLLPAMQRGTRLFVVECALPDHAGDMPMHKEQLQRFQDLSMFKLFGAGQKTLQEWKDLFRKADRRMRVAAVQQPEDSMLSFIDVVLDREE